MSCWSRVDWLRSKTPSDRRIATKRQQAIGSFPFLRQLRIEPLEDRRLLSITVNTLVDEADGSIVDDDISLRDAIALAAAGETINFSVTGTINLIEPWSARHQQESHDHWSRRQPAHDQRLRSDAHDRQRRWQPGVQYQRRYSDQSQHLDPRCDANRRR